MIELNHGLQLDKPAKATCRSSLILLNFLRVKITTTSSNYKKETHSKYNVYRNGFVVSLSLYLSALPSLLGFAVLFY